MLMDVAQADDPAMMLVVVRGCLDVLLPPPPHPFAEMQTAERVKRFAKMGAGERGAALAATYADVCWRMLAYADVCWRMLTYAGRRWGLGRNVGG